MKKLVTLDHHLFLYKQLHTTFHFMILIQHIITNVAQIFVAKLKSVQALASFWAPLFGRNTPPWKPT